MPMDWERERHFDDRYNQRFDRGSRGRSRREERFARPDVREDAFRDEEEFLRGLEAASGPSRYPRDRRDLDYGYPEGDPWDDGQRYAGSRLPHPDEVRFGRSTADRQYPGTPYYGQVGNVHPDDYGAEGYGPYGTAEARSFDAREGGRWDDRSGGRYGGYGPRGQDGRRGEIRGGFREAYRGDAPGLRRADHRGRGPKNYTRSDDRILEDVNDILSDDGHIDASDIEVEVQDGEVTLSGTVSSRFAKRHAEDLAESASGVRNCQNNLRVVSGGSETDEPSQD